MIPQSITNLVNLIELGVHDNQLMGNVPDTLKSKFDSDSFKNNLFENMDNQMQLTLL